MIEFENRVANALESHVERFVREQAGDRDTALSFAFWLAHYVTVALRAAAVTSAERNFEGLDEPHEWQREALAALRQDS